MNDDFYKKLHDEVVLTAPTAALQDMLSKAWLEVKHHSNICASISGGSDSDVLMDLLVRLDPSGEKTRFIYFNTGMEYDAAKRHLHELEEKYGRTIEWVPPVLPIPTCCKRYGVPFWSKRISEYIYRLQRHGFQWEDEPFAALIQKYSSCRAALRWWCNDWPKKDNGAESNFNIAYIPYLKEFMMQRPPTFKISAKCCEKAKKEPAAKFQAGEDFDLICNGVRKAEKGARSEAYKSCFTQVTAGPDQYRPLFWLSDDDKKDYKTNRGLRNSDCYEVWGMTRTGCPGCPYGKDFEQELELMQRYEPKFYKACLNIFGASYDYTREYLEFREKMKAQRKD